MAEAVVKLKLGIDSQEVDDSGGKRGDGYSTTRQGHIAMSFLDKFRTLERAVFSMDLECDHENPVMTSGVLVNFGTLPST